MAGCAERCLARHNFSGGARYSRKRGGVAAQVSLKLRANARARALHGHPWVFGNEVESLLPAAHDGEVVECRDRTNRLIGTGIYNSKSQIVWRRLSRDRVTLDAAYFRSAIERALGRRAPENVRRIVWSESDDLPGVVVDQYGDVLVVQIQTLAMEKRAAVLGDVLDTVLKPAEIIFRNDGPIRRLEGLPLEVHSRSGRVWEPRWLRIEGFDYWLDLQGGQKTGFYLDQRRQHPTVAKYCRGARVLDAFCNQGAFALHAARAGASEVLGIDSAEDAIEAARKNAAHNGVAAEFMVANVFDWFNAPDRNIEPLWDVVILDPPPFAKSRSALEGALRGYKEINLRAVKRLVGGGILATYTCSHHMQDAELRQVLAEVSTDARRKLRILEWSHQPPDHPVMVTMPESEYLRGYIVSVE
jgi:23S rRNA (cytosine1962-C5)-methyltransferase